MGQEIGGILQQQIKPGSARCKEDGSFEFTGVPLGKYIISTDPRVMMASDEVSAKLISVEPGKTYELELVHR